MPAKIVVVLDEPGLAEKTAEVLIAAGYDTLSLQRPLLALDTLDEAVRVELLITSVDHPGGQPNGVSLSRMAKKRHPQIKVIVIGPPHMAHHAEAIGVFLPVPLTVQQLADRAVDLLSSTD